MQFQYNKIFDPVDVMGYKCLSNEIKDVINIKPYKEISKNLVNKKIYNSDNLKIKILDKIIKSNIENKNKLKKFLVIMKVFLKKILNIFMISIKK